MIFRNFGPIFRNFYPNFQNFSDFKCIFGNFAPLKRNFIFIFIFYKIAERKLAFEVNLINKFNMTVGVFTGATMSLSHDF